MEIKEGYYDAQIKAVKIIKSRYAKPDEENKLEVEIECSVWDENHNALAESPKVYLELSNEYPKFGDTTKPMYQITINRLHEIGFEGNDLTTLEGQLKNKNIRLNYRVKDKNGTPLKGGPAWYLSAARKIEVIAPEKANAILAQMMSGGFGSVQTSAPAPEVNPFD